MRGDPGLGAAVVLKGERSFSRRAPCGENKRSMSAGNLSCISRRPESVAVDEKKAGAATMTNSGQKAAGRRLFAGDARWQAPPQPAVHQ
jgi:hypothetical protein